MNEPVRRLLPLALCLLACAACTERRLFVRTDPPGANVKVNGDAIGPSPAVWRFEHYGTVLIEVELEGYEPREKRLDLRVPWWQRPGIDFFADVLLPAKARDDHEITLRLRPTPSRTEAQLDAETAAVAARAAALRARAAEEDDE